MTTRNKLIAALLAGLAAFVGYPLNDGKPPAPATAPPPRAFGWVRDPAAVTAAIDSPPFAAT